MEVSDISGAKCTNIRLYCSPPNTYYLTYRVSQSKGDNPIHNPGVGMRGPSQHVGLAQIVCEINTLGVEL